MTKRIKAKTKTRMRHEIVEAMRGLHKVGAVNEHELTKTTLRMLGKEALPTVEAMSPAEIAGVRAQSGISQAVLAAYLNVAVGTVSQWERGEPSDGRGTEVAQYRQAERNRRASMKHHPGFENVMKRRARAD
jgi:DNA-binding transcriptional regulator YiaG